MIIHAAYGSSKDISVYSALDLKPKQIFIIGKVSRKHHTMATVLSDGYAAHLSALQCHGGSRPAQGNARMLLTSRGRFGHNASMRRRRCVFKLFVMFNCINKIEIVHISISIVNLSEQKKRFMMTSL